MFSAFCFFFDPYLFFFDPYLFFFWSLIVFFLIPLPCLKGSPCLRQFESECSDDVWHDSTHGKWCMVTHSALGIFIMDINIPSNPYYVMGWWPSPNMGIKWYKDTIQISTMANITSYNHLATNWANYKLQLFSLLSGLDDSANPGNHLR